MRPEDLLCFLGENCEHYDAEELVDVQQTVSCFKMVEEVAGRRAKKCTRYAFLLHQLHIYPIYLCL